LDPAEEFGEKEIELKLDDGDELEDEEEEELKLSMSTRRQKAREQIKRTGSRSVDLFNDMVGTMKQQLKSPRTMDIKKSLIFKSITSSSSTHNKESAGGGGGD